MWVKMQYRGCVYIFEFCDGRELLLSFMTMIAVKLDSD